MQLDCITAVVRPRNAYEAIDLGFSLIQAWWRPLYIIWLSCVIPLTLLLYLLFYVLYETVQIPMLIIWWLKPLFDRILLHFLSHALFGEYPTVRQTNKALPNLLKTRLFIGLTIGRIDPARSFNLPVWQLEGLRGKPATQRINLLQKSTRSTAVWFTLICVHFEWVLYLSLFVLMYLLTPVNAYGGRELFTCLLCKSSTLWIEIMTMSFSLLVLTIVEPLYVAGGFALYLNRRTHLEGWDIELAFRRMIDHGH